MKLSNALLVGLCRAAITADDDGSCQLMTAICDETGFTITFDSGCRDSDYKAIKINELYANGPTYSTSTLTYGNSPTVNSECLFNDNDGDGVYTMKFSFTECGTTHATGNTADLVYYNKVQAQEYYTDVIMGVKVDFSLTCTADRVAIISGTTTDIDGDKDFESLDAQDRPAEWAQNILNMNFYSNAALTTAMTDNLIPLGENIYPEVTTNVVNEDLKTRLTECWATPSSDNADVTSFKLIENSCSTQSWVAIDDTVNGATESSTFAFQSFRFPSQNSFWLHCQVYMCHSAEDCLHSCAAGRRRRALTESASTTGEDGVDYQTNGLPKPHIISRELFVTETDLDDMNAETDRARKVINRIAGSLASMQRNFKATRKAVNFLEKIINGDA